jgi:septum formation protein
VTSTVPRTLLLASGSPARLRLLRDAGIEPRVVVSGVPETAEDGIGTAALVATLAERKAVAVAELHPGELVLGCDSMLDLDGIAIGKPASAASALALLRGLAGRDAVLYTGHRLIDGRSGRQACGVAATIVRFGSITEAELSAYVATGEPLQLAGAFSIDGRGAPFVDGVDGDPSNVIGLSLPLLRRLLAELGIPITSLWRPAAGSARP